MIYRYVTTTTGNATLHHMRHYSTIFTSLEAVQYFFCFMLFVREFRTQFEKVTSIRVQKYFGTSSRNVAVVSVVSVQPNSGETQEMTTRL